MAAKESTIFTPTLPMLVQASEEDPIKVSVGADTLRYGTSRTALNSSLSAGQTTNFTSAQWIKLDGAGLVAIESYDPWAVLEDSNVAETVEGDVTFQGDVSIQGLLEYDELAVGSDDPGSYPESQFRVYSNEVAITGRKVGAHFQHDYTPGSAAGTIDYHGLDILMDGDSANVSANVGVYAIENNVVYSGTGTLGRMVSSYDFAQVTGAALVSSDVTLNQQRASVVSGATVQEINGTWFRSDLIAAGSAMNTVTAFRTDDLAGIDGTVGDAYVLYSEGGKSYHEGNFGIGIDDPIAALHLGSDAADNVSGIIFGSGIDTQLYRDAEGSLTLNGTGAGGRLLAAGLIQSGSYIPVNGNTGANRAIFGYANGGNGAGATFGSGLDVWVMRSSATTLLSNAALATSRTTVPADGDLSAGQVAIWFDPTNSAAKIKFKAKETGGTVRTGEVALT